MRTYEYLHMDVFASRRMEGNGLAVVLCASGLTDGEMLDITREFKQFETVFLSDYDETGVTARIFTMEGELPFAGHPVLGAAAAVHGRYRADTPELALSVRLGERQVPVVSRRTAFGHHARMCQGPAAFLGTLDGEARAWLLRAHTLTEADWEDTLPVEVVSTGLPYAIVPLRGGLATARIATRDLEAFLARHGAAYCYLLDVHTLEARTWDNLGLVEDSATGSAAGPACAYLQRHGRIAGGQAIAIRQGAYANRPGVLHAQVRGGDVYVSGDVVRFAGGSLTL